MRHVDFKGMRDTEEAIDEAIREHYSRIAPDDGPVIAWCLLVATDNDGGQVKEVLWIQSPEGQRGLVTAGLIHEAGLITSMRDAIRREGDD